MKQSVFSKEHKHIIVNYHYVENPRKDFPGIHPCSVDEFERQIRFLSRHWRIGSVHDVFKAAHGGANEKFCAITFDDGLKDQYTEALPVLEKYRVPAAFFIITGTLQGLIPLTHKIHLLLSALPADELVDRANEFLKKHNPDDLERFVIPKDRRLTLERKLRDDIPTANFKEAVNMIPADTADAMLEDMMKQQKSVARDVSDLLFMTGDEISDLERRGHEIGSHGHTHRALDYLSESELTEEVSGSHAILTDLLGHAPSVFSYPHGGAGEAFSRAVGKAGYSYALGTEERAVAPDANPYFIPRFDTVTVKTFLDESIV